MTEVQTLRDTAPSNDDRFVQQVRRNVEQTWSWYDRAYEYGRGERREERRQEALHIAQEALSQYDIEAGGLELVRNMIVIGGPLAFRVTSGDRTYALHVYNPSPMNVENPLDGLTGIRDRADVLQSGLQWFDALNRDTELSVQAPISNREGRFVTQVEVDTGLVNCALLDWVEGEEVSEDHRRNIGRSMDDIRHLGTVLGKIHEHSRQWDPPEAFVLPRVDRTKLNAALVVLRWAAEQG